MSNTGKIGLMAVIAGLLAFAGWKVYSDSSGTSTSNASTINASSSTPASSTPASNLNIDAKNAAANATKTPTITGPLTVVSFANMEHDFGKIDQQTENEHIFKFTNTGTEPLIISAAKGSCGCTVPQYPKEPIPPGEEGEIKVVYKPGKQKNKQTKRVTVTANTEPEQTVLKITAEVQELPEG